MSTLFHHNLIGLSLLSLRGRKFACFLLSWGALTSAAWAHGGRVVETNAIAINPSDSRTLLVRNTLGFFVTRDLGQSWQWFCYQSLERALFREDPILLWTGTEQMVAGMIGGLALGSEGGCAWSFSEAELGDQIISVVAQDPNNMARLYAASAQGDAFNQVWVSDDAGLNWNEVVVALAQGDLPNSLAWSAPVDGSSQGWLAALRLEPRQLRILDLSSSQVGSLALANHETATLVGVDESRLYALVQSSAVADRVLVTHNLGQNWQVIFERETIAAFTLSQDGQSWVGGPAGDDGRGGLWRAAQGEPFAPFAPDISIRCLKASAEVIWACTDYFEQGYALARWRWTDGNASVPDGLLNLTDVAGPLNCPNTSAVGQFCNFCGDYVTDLAYFENRCDDQGNWTGSRTSTGCQAPYSADFPGMLMWVFAAYVLRKKKTHLWFD